MARVDRHIYGSTTIPLATLITFGVIPTFTEEEFGYSFSFNPPHQEQDQVPVEYSYRSRTTLGWIATFQALSPEVSVFPFNEEHSSRFRGRLALVILDHAESLTKLTQKSRE